jgi:hypothetical protein
MTTPAKLVRSIDRDITAIGVLGGMTPYALLETVLGGTDALTHGQITLMEDQFHVVAPHELGVLHTTLTSTFWMYRNGNSTGTRLLTGGVRTADGGNTE